MIRARRRLAAPSGRTDRMSTLLVAAVALFSVGIAPEFALLVGAAVLTGVALAIANPATNKLISTRYEPGRQGLIVGVKQAGAQIGIFFGSCLLPVFAGWWGWRWAVITFAAIPLVTAMSYMRRRSAGAGRDALDRDEAGERDADGTSLRQVSRSARRLIHRLTIYAFLGGVGAAAAIYYLPLYAEEALKMTSEQAGQALAFSGLVGIVGRIGWARVAESRLGTGLFWFLDRSWRGRPTVWLVRGSARCLYARLARSRRPFRFRVLDHV